MAKTRKTSPKSNGARGSTATAKPKAPKAAKAKAKAPKAKAKEPKESRDEVKAIKPPKARRTPEPDSSLVDLDDDTVGRSLAQDDGPAARVSGGGRSRRAEAAPRSHKAPSSAAPGKYVYCIIAASDALRFGHIGIGAEPAEVHSINYKDIAAVVSDTPIEVYDPTRDNVLAHERVNELVMRENTVIPMSFGTVFRSRDDILELLRSAYQAFKDVLVKMQGKLEFGLKVLWDPDAVIRQIEKEDESIRRLKKEISSQKGSTYFARMQYGRLVDAQLSERSERYVTEIFNALRDVSVASRANKPIGDRMIMNAAFLVSRDQEAAFDAKVKEIGGRLDHLTFKYTGPWPPYNFVNIRLKLERARNG
jgi:hypothetical protein